MEINSSLWKVPNDFFKKYDFPELTVINKIFKDQKKLIDQLENSFSILEKTYKSAANSMSSHSLTTIAVATNDEINQFNQMVQSHNLLSKHFANYSQKFGYLRVNKLVPFQNNFQNKIKNVELEMNRVKLILNQPFEELVKARVSLDRYINELQKLCLIQQPTQQEVQRIDKFIVGTNKKLMKINQCYMSYRIKFDEYCNAREQLLNRIDKLVNDSKSEIKEMIDEGKIIDQDMFQSPPSSNESLNKEINSGLFKQPEPKENKNDFKVTVDRDININGTNEKLSPSESYVVVEARGDKWKIKNNKNEIFIVSSECLVPIQNKNI